MEIELPDGTILEAPDDADVKAVVQGYRRAAVKGANRAEYDPSSPQYKAKYGAASGGGLENFLAGTGKGFVDLARGAKQLLGGMSEADVDATKQQDAALMGTTSGRVGNFVGNVAALAPTAFIPGVNTYTGAGLVGAGAGLLRPVGADDSRTTNVALGAAGGLAGKFLGDKLAAGIQNARQNPVAAGARLRTKGAELGMRTTPGQATGNKALQRIEAAMESKAFTAGPLDRIKEGNQAALNKAWAKAIGEKSDKLTDDVLDSAFTRIGSVFDDAADDVQRAIDPDDFLQKFASIENELDGVSAPLADNPLVKQVMTFASKGGATGKQLQALNSKLGKAAYKQMSGPSGDRDLGMALYQVKDYVDDLLQSGLSGERKAAFEAARGQYRNLMLLTSRVGNVNPVTGNASGRSLANTLQTKDKAGFLRGKNTSDHYEAARFAKAYQSIVGDSGTATRSQGPIDMIVGIPFNILARAYASQPTVNAMLGAQYAGQAGMRALPNELPRYLLPAGIASANTFGQ